jgi:hypothetical protein
MPAQTLVTEADTFTAKKSIVSTPEMTAVDAEHTVTLKTCLVCTQNVMSKELIRNVLMS